MKQTTWEFRNIDKFPLLCLILATFSSKKIKKFSLYSKMKPPVIVYTHNYLLQRLLVASHFLVLLKSLISKNNISRKQANYFQEFLKYYIFKEVYIIQEVLK